MSIAKVLSVLIGLLSVIAWFIVIYAGSMRTTGGTSSDAHLAFGVLVGGLIAAVALWLSAGHVRW